MGSLLWWTSCTTWQAGTAAAGCGTVDQEEEEEEEGEKQACTPPLRPQRQLLGRAAGSPGRFRDVNSVFIGKSCPDCGFHKN